MTTDIMSGNAIVAAYRAMDNPAFYNVTLKNYVTPWTNEAQNVFEPLNDYTATVIGMIRDDVPFDSVLSDDILYVGDGGLGLPAYSIADNAHYEALEDRGIDLSTALVRRQQSTLTGLPPEGTAGVMTTRAAAAAYFVAGTNRAMLRFTLINHLCRDLEQVADTTLPPDRIRQDVTRSPGGDSRVFLNNCVGCHSGMDPLTGAFAHYDWDEEAATIVYTPTQVRPKYSINEQNFSFGYITTDAGWENRWREGKNSVLGWDPGLPGSGQGARSLGEELAASEAFAECHVEKAFEAVCLRPPVDQADRDAVDGLVTEFMTNGYQMKRVFAGAAVHCMGD